MTYAVENSLYVGRGLGVVCVSVSWCRLCGAQYGGKVCTSRSFKTDGEWVPACLRGLVSLDCSGTGSWFFAYCFRVGVGMCVWFARPDPFGYSPIFAATIMWVSCGRFGVGRCHCCGPGRGSLFEFYVFSNGVGAHRFGELMGVV